MNYLGADPTPELTTTRTGGRSARVVAVAVGALLVGVIYVGISGQNGSVAATPAPLVAAQTPAPTQRTLPRVDAIQAIRANPDAPVLYQYLGARLSFGGHATLAILDAVSDDGYRVSYRIPYPLVASPANLNVSTVIDTVSHDEFDVLGTWIFPLDAIAGSGAPPVVLLDDQQPPAVRTLANPTFTRVARNGFRVIATAEGLPEFALLTVDVEVNPDPTEPGETQPPRIYPSEDYTVVAKVGGQAFATGPSTFLMLPGHMGGEILMPLSLGVKRVSVEVSAIPSADPLLGRIVVAHFSIPVPRIEDHAITRLFTVPGVQPNPGYPQITQSGYRLRLVSTFNGAARALFWELVINPTSATVGEVLHNWVTGDDGLIGWPSALK